MGPVEVMGGWGDRSGRSLRTADALRRLRGIGGRSSRLRDSGRVRLDRRVFLGAVALATAGCVDDGDLTSSNETNDTNVSGDGTASDGAMAGDAADDGVDDRENGSGAPLDSQLRGLAAAEAPSRYAERNELSYRDGRVAVTVRLREGGSTPQGFDLVDTSRAGDLMETSVPVDELRRFADSDEVLRVRARIAASQDAGRGGVSAGQMQDAEQNGSTTTNDSDT